MIVVIVVAVAIIFGIQALTLVTIPLVLALILASAFWPVMHAMRGTVDLTVYLGLA